ncbi:hypothetical protein [Chryseobacterium sp. SIMBA_029]|uniref:hypothetical protein n=1 Tax=Chryseobacterium sp. SIMBA_029 TaxID=3085772 RepID=UPI00397C96AC
MVFIHLEENYFNLFFQSIPIQIAYINEFASILVIIKTSWFKKNTLKMKFH